ncbi:MarR family winged helix-turn-helix transcriptional regulator [Paenibacillus sp. SN-8-1]|uniref:MarR family winged helix-turn-helix transcriptional regulator n=1 Tax=Paenibacillus sp. SN-8-1 TaxID=3435409 RepID=UPI003D9A4702
MRKEPIGKLISLIHRHSQKSLNKRLAAYDLGGGGQHSFLKTILHKPGINQDQLTHDLKFDKATTARAVKQLEQAGYITRIVNNQDRRSLSLFPTDKAEAFFPQLQSILDEHNNRLTRNLTEDEQLQLIALLSKVNLETEE